MAENNENELETEVQETEVETPEVETTEEQTEVTVNVAEDKGKESERKKVVAKEKPAVKEPANLEEAVEIIKKLSMSLSEANSEAASRRLKLKDYEAAEKVRVEELEKKRKEELSEIERLQEENRDKDAKLAAVSSETLKLKRRFEFARATEEAGYKFNSVQAGDDAFALADFSEVEVDEDGNLEGMDKVVKSLYKSRGYLFVQKEENPDLNSQNRGGGQRTPTVDEILKRNAKAETTTFNFGGYSWL